MPKERILIVDDEKNIVRSLTGVLSDEGYEISTTGAGVKALEIIQKFDVICDCSDNFGTRYLINDACLILNKPLIFGSVQGFEGQAFF